MGDTPDYVNGQPKPKPNDGASMHTLVIKDIEQRKQYGLNKYDSLLQTFNGRNFLQDAYEEVQDLIVYLKGSLEEQRIVALLFRDVLKGYVHLYDQLYPDNSEQVIITAGNLPGWIVDTHREVLGDRFEYLESGKTDSGSDGRVSEGSSGA